LTTRLDPERRRTILEDKTVQGNGAKARWVLDAWTEVWLSPREPTRSGGATAV